jgi:hypothetical protein
VPAGFHDACPAGFRAAARAGFLDIGLAASLAFALSLPLALGPDPCPASGPFPPAPVFQAARPMPEARAAAAVPAQGADNPLIRGFAAEPPMTADEIPLALDLVTVSRSPDATEEDFRVIRESFGLSEQRAAFIMTRTAAAILILDDPANRERVAAAFGTPHAVPTAGEIEMVSSYLRGGE